MLSEPNQNLFPAKIKRPAELNHFLVMAQGTEPTPPTAEDKKILVVAIRTTNPSKTLMKIAVLQVFPDNMRPDRVEEAIFTIKAIDIAFL